MKVCVVGATGFLGGELVRLIDGHPRIELEMACAGKSAGQKLSDVRPGFSDDRLIEASNAEEIAKRCETAFLALPHGASAKLAAELLEKGVTVYDLGSDFRLKSPADVHKFYGRGAPSQDLLDQAVYCLPELTGGPAPDAKLVSCPGCFASAMALTLAPLKGLADSFQVFGVTGSSGSGNVPMPNVHHSTRSTGFTAYKALTHQHLGEVGQLLKSDGFEPRIDFVPHSLPAVRGIHLTTLSDAPLDQVKAAYAAAYSDKPLISLHDGPINLGMVIGSVRTAIGAVSAEGKTAIFTVIDNLLKGGSGQAIQNFNLQQGWPETEGLPVNGMWP